MVFIAVMLFLYPAEMTSHLFELKGQLAQAEMEANKLQHRILFLKEEIAKRELQLIQNELNKVQKAFSNHHQAPPIKKLEHLMKQRETLISIMERVPSYREQAEKLHEELLRFITKLGNDQSLEETVK